jgi:predicted amidophosphoribosyltransferase
MWRGRLRERLNNMSEKHCPECGRDLSVPTTVCGRCGARSAIAERRRTVCGPTTRGHARATLAGRSARPALKVRVAAKRGNPDPSCWAFLIERRTRCCWRLN